MSFLDTLIFGYRTILDAGTEKIQRSKLNFIGATIEDNPVTGATDVTLAGGAAPTGTGFRHITADSEDPTAKKVDLSDTADVTGTLAVARGGTGQTSGTVAFIAAVQTLTMKVIDAASNTITGLTNSNIASGAAIALSKFLAPTGTGLVKATSGAWDAATSLLVNADVNAAAAIAGTKIAPNFGSQAVGTTGYFYTATTNPAGVGNLRMAHGDKICYRNSLNSADATLMATSGDTLYIGLNTSFADTAFNIIQCPSNAQYIGVASNYFLVITNNLLEVNAPILGYSGSEFGIHGAIDSAMADSNYTAPAGERAVGTIKIVSAFTASRTMTWPHPSSMGRSYRKFFINTSGQNLVLSTGTGTNATVSTGTTKLVEFTTGGARILL